jgi:hypothetical protein
MRNLFFVCLAFGKHRSLLDHDTKRSAPNIFDQEDEIYNKIAVGNIVDTEDQPCMHITMLDRPPCGACSLGARSGGYNIRRDRFVVPRLKP